jgi:hypothetical protein
MKRMLIVIFWFSCVAVAAQDHTSSSFTHANPQQEGLAFIHNAPGKSPFQLDDWTFSTNAAILASGKMADLTGDGVPEILLTTYGIVNPYWEGWVHAWNGAGVELPGYPLQVTGAAPGTSAIGDLDHDGDNEIVQGTWNYLYVLNADGSIYPGFPLSMYITQTAALADLDGDEDLEIIVPVNNQMRVYHHTGTPYAGFPVSGIHDLTSAAVGDLDGDGSLEIVAGDFVASGSPSDHLYAWHSDGSVVAGFPFTATGTIKVPPALADLDHDGTREIIFDTWVNTGTDLLYVLNHNGLPEPGWPLSLPYIRLSSPSTADLDLDGDLEILVGGWSTTPSGEVIHAYHHNATVVSGFPVIFVNSPSGNVNSTPITGDIDGDGFPEIIVKVTNHIIALRHDGSMAAGFPVFLDDTNHTGTTSPTPVLGDPDNDGRVEIFAASTYNTVVLLDQPGALNPARNDWPSFRCDPHNTGTHLAPAAFPRVTVSFQPTHPPVVIPASGGSFRYRIAVTNQDSIAQTFDGWTILYAPVVPPFITVYADLTLPAGASLSRFRQQYIPATAPAGTYTWTAYVGDFQSVIWDQDGFTFVKLGVDDASSEMSFWRPDEDLFGDAAVTDDFDLILSACPNPFNPATTVRFALPQAGVVKLEILDVSGRKVAVPVDGLREAGRHEVAFDGARLPSGVYFAKLSWEGNATVRKLVLMK